ncbi:hypothetical protein KUTeg_021824 [Tegillarca granosa]|uniref:Uncharacterized protein n=1 Tax=Tegillarca granosa TaxID=220873 RepID=A0ABQ9E5A7_TEGGR|nr:hypothetical protein KUTeg_021824 [Tegillarca granosa]
MSTLELGSHEIRVNSVNPTDVVMESTKQFLSNDEYTGPYLPPHPLGRFTELDDVVNATLFLSSDGTAIITGSNVAVDGGWLIS